MFEFIETILAVVGACAIAFGFFSEDEPPEPADDPYRDGLDSAARLSAMGFAAEKAMFEAAYRDHND